MFHFGFEKNPTAYYESACLAHIGPGIDPHNGGKNRKHGALGNILLQIEENKKLTLEFKKVQLHLIIIKRCNEKWRNVRHGQFC